MKILCIRLLPSLLLGIATTPKADLVVNFVESAPRDWFEFSNTGRCDLQALSLTVDLTSSVGELVFDTTEGGAGVEVYQPFEVKQGDINLVSSTPVIDGDQTLTVSVPLLAASATASFTIDVDDTISSGALGPTMISSSEIAQATVMLSIGKRESVIATFGNNNQAVFDLQNCEPV